MSFSANQTLTAADLNSAFAAVTPPADAHLIGSTGTAFVAVALGSGVAINSGTLSATGTGGTVTSVVSGAGLHAGTITNAGTLLADWNGGTVSHLGAGLSLTSGTLTASGSGGSVTSLVAGTGLNGGTITTTGSISANWQGGTVTTIGDGLNLNSGTLIARPSYAGTLTAAGSVQAGALTLTADINSFTTVAAGAGGRLLATPVAGTEQRIINRGTASVLIYPASGAQIEAAGTNVGVPVVAGGSALFTADSTTQWYVT